MSDGSSVGGGIAEGLTSLVKGVGKGMVDETKNVVSTGLAQAAPSIAPQNSPTPQAETQSYKTQDTQKVMQIRGKLHNEMANLNSKSSPQTEQPKGPIAEQAFQSSHLQQFGDSPQQKKGIVAVDIGRTEKGHGAKG